MVSFILRLKPNPESRQDLLAILNSMRGPLNVRQNCLACELYETQEDDNNILYLEQWSSKEALYDHIRSDLYLKILMVMEMVVEEPNIYISEIASTQGMELIQKLRGCE